MPDQLVPSTSLPAYPSVYTMSELLSYFGKELRQKNNYLYLVRKYLQFCLKENYLIDDISFGAHTTGKPPSMISPVRKFLRFAKAHGIRAVRPDPAQPKVSPAAHELILQFIAENTTLRGKESKTKYIQGLNAFFLFMEEKQTGFSAPLAEQFIQHLRVEDYAPFTVNLYLSAIRQFAQWVLRRHEQLSVLLSESQLSALRNVLLVRGLPIEQTFYKDSLSRQEREHLFSVIDDTKWQAIVALMAYCGLRTEEVTRLKTGDLDFGQQKLYVLGKGKATRLPVKLFQACICYLQAYLHQNACTKEDRLFPALTTRQIRYHVGKYLARAGLKRDKLSAHSLRHTCGQLLLASGVDPVFVQRQLRHKKFDTTQFYVKKQLEQDYLRQMPEDY